MNIKDVFTPFTVWSKVIKDPVTIKNPIGREAAPRYRGFHKNDIEACIGCGTCEAICENQAIDLVPVEGIDTKSGDSGLRPRIDYGRCCWCALCVDICTTNSLNLTNEYTWVDTDPDAFIFTPPAQSSSEVDSEGYSREYKRCLDNSGGVTSEMRNCNGNELKFQDNLLNKL